MLTGEKSNRKWYAWCVFADEPPQVISQIQSVEYVLHPTFPDPLRTKVDKRNLFALFSAGWGGFLIRITVFFENGSVLRTQHDLKLVESGWPKGDVPRSFSDDRVRAVYDNLSREKVRWRSTEAIAKRTGLPLSQTQTILEDLERRKLVRRIPLAESVDDKEHWGATAVVGLLPADCRPGPNP